jgi:DNA mismatch endonuclease (patch repair protein)
MARIRGRNTGPEVALGKAIWRSGFRYRKHVKTPGGRPDFVFASKKVVVFLDGCQWHGCPDHYVRPRTRNEFWGKKLAENVARDRRQTLALEAGGWTVLRIWEHAVRRNPAEAAEAVIVALEGTPVPAKDDYRVVAVDVIDRAADTERRHLEELRDARRTLVMERKRTTAKV